MVSIHPKGVGDKLLPLLVRWGLFIGLFHGMCYDTLHTLVSPQYNFILVHNDVQ